MKTIILTDRYNNCFRVIDYKHRWCSICNLKLTRTAIKKHYNVYHSHQRESPKMSYNVTSSLGFISNESIPTSLHL